MEGKEERLGSGGRNERRKEGKKDGKRERKRERGKERERERKKERKKERKRERERERERRRKGRRKKSVLQRDKRKRMDRMTNFSSQCEVYLKAQTLKEMGTA